MPSKVLPAICTFFFFRNTFFSRWPTFRLACKYFQLAAFVMLIYDHSKLVILSKPLASTQVWIFPSANFWPGGLSVIPFHLEILTLDYFARLIASGSRSCRVPLLYSWSIDMSPPFNLLLFSLVSLQIFSLVGVPYWWEPAYHDPNLMSNGWVTCILDYGGLTSLQMQ